jgi:hypothetical protein
MIIVDFLRVGTVSPKTQLHIHKMTDKITLELTLEELNLIDKYVELNDETQSVFVKIKDAYPKSKTLTDLIHRWWEDVFTIHSDWDSETSIEDLVDQIEMWLPKEHDTNSYKWNQCIRTIKEKLR